MTRRGVVVLLVALAAPAACARTRHRTPPEDAGPPPPKQAHVEPADVLSKAAALADAAELERAALRLSPEALVAAFEDPRRRVRLAAVDAAPFADRPWTFLAPLVERLADGDRETASRAAAGALEITSVDDERAVVEAELTDGDLAAVAERVAGVASDPRLAPDLRAAAAVVAARLRAHVPVEPTALLEAARDPDPAVRHASLEALRGWRSGLRSHGATLREIFEESRDPRTALLAAGALCAAGALGPDVLAKTRELLPRGLASDRALLARCVEEPARPTEKAKKRTRKRPAAKN